MHPALGNPKLLALLLVAVASRVHCLAPDAPDFSQIGPCTATYFQESFPLPQELAELGKSLALTLTVPSCPDGPQEHSSFNFGRGQWHATPKQPYPVVIFYSGFQLRAAWYHLITAHLASWGWVTVQYDTPFLTAPTAALEVAAFPYLFAWIQNQSITSDSALYGVVDPSTAAVAGHSRGGKLAALVFANNPQLGAAYLIDPMDSSSMAPISPDNPSGVDALAKSGKSIGVTGAGIHSACNPEQGNYRHFFNVSGSGSWQEEIPGASHLTFEDAGSVINVGQDVLCGRGPAGRDLVAELTSTPILAWFWRELGLNQSQKFGFIHQILQDPLDSFLAWVRQEVQAGLITFTIKDEETYRSNAFLTIS